MAVAVAVKWEAAENVGREHGHLVLHRLTEGGHFPWG